MIASFGALFFLKPFCGILFSHILQSHPTNPTYVTTCGCDVFLSCTDLLSCFGLRLRPFRPFIALFLDLLSQLNCWPWHPLTRWMLTMMVWSPERSPWLAKNGRRAAEKLEISFHGSAAFRRFVNICQHGIFKRYIFSGYNRRDLVVHFHRFVELYLLVYFRIQYRGPVFCKTSLLLRPKLLSVALRFMAARVPSTLAPGMSYGAPTAMPTNFIMEPTTMPPGAAYGAPSTMGPMGAMPTYAAPPTTAMPTMQAPVTYAAPMTQAPPVTYAAPMAQEQPVTYAAPTTQAPPVTYAAPMAQEQPVTYAAPMTQAPPVTYAAPMAQEQPVTYAAPMTQAPPVTYAAPMAQEQPVTYAAPMTQAPIYAQMPGQVVTWQCFVRILGAYFNLDSRSFFCKDWEHKWPTFMVFPFHLLLGLLLWNTIHNSCESPSKQLIASVDHVDQVTWPREVLWFRV